MQTRRATVTNTSQLTITAAGMVIGGIVILEFIAKIFQRIITCINSIAAITFKISFLRIVIAIVRAIGIARRKR